MRYAYVKFSKWDFGFFRLLGPGLGNLLFPWARMVVAAQQNGLRMLWPTWPQIKIGPIIRRERDLRFYTNLFVNPGHYIAGAKKGLIRLLYPSIGESQASAYSKCQTSDKHKLIIFEGMEYLFAPLIGQRKIVLAELLNITHPEHLKGLSHDFSNSISIHIRLGDFEQADDKLLRSGKRNMRLPLFWMSDVISRLRSELGQDLRVWIFSDGTDEELRTVLRIPGVQRLYFGSALADMLAMSRSRALIVSSTFSMWAAYLGEVPSIYYPGQKQQRLLENVNLEIEYDGGNEFSADFLFNINRGPAK